MSIHLLLFFIPGIHQIPVERQVPLNLRSFRQRLGIAPGCMFSTSVTDPHSPVGGFAFERRMCAMFRCFQQIHSHIFQWKIEDGQATKFV